VSPANGQLSTLRCVASYQGKFQLRGPDVFIFMALRNRELHARNDDT